MKKLLLLALILTINVCFALPSRLNVWNMTEDKTLYFTAILGKTNCQGGTYETYIPNSNTFYCSVAPENMIDFQTIMELSSLYPTMQIQQFNSSYNLINTYDTNNMFVANTLVNNGNYNWSMFRYKIEDASRNHTEGINNLGFADYAACHPLYTCWGKNENTPGYDPNGQILPGDPNCPQNSFMNSGNTETFSFTMFEITGERFFVVSDFN